MPIPLEPKRPEDHIHTKEMDEKRRTDSVLQSVKRIIAVHSGKGGVGKTFLTVNLAYALAHQGLDVGILDADIDCPNVPKFLGIDSSMFFSKKKRFLPVNHQGVKVVSMGLTQDDEGSPVLVRGPVKHRMALDLLTNTEWGALDMLIIDMPPGTADVPLSLLEFGNIEGVMYVTTPQKDALMDTLKSIRMGEQFGVNALGLVENMSGSVFGKDKAVQLAEETGIPYIGTIPLSEQIMQENERGDIAFMHPDMESVANKIMEAIK
ncbi:Mrp/NBP35 family ATP-binding protein [Candidatus Woesearchaeota archaeon]|nr:Mrp/NBP35 family ATP-binding protein [Candidatus Woesearchaeota archaeon]